MMPGVNAERPEWHGLTFSEGSDIHLLPFFEDERDHDIHNGEDCHCSPLKEMRFGERKNELPYNVITHNIVRGAK